MTDAPDPDLVDRPTGRQWVDDLARQLGVEAPDDATAETLLDIAGVAAHASERLAAPLACYLIGRAGADPAAVLRALET